MSLDASFLQQHVGPALAKALSEVVVKNPEDAIDFIGNYLIKYAKDNEELLAESSKIQETQNVQQAAEATVASQNKAKKSLATALATQLQDDEALFTELAEAQARFESPEDGVVKPSLGPELRLKTLAVVQKVIDYVKSRTGANACYLGELRSMPEDGPKFLSYSTTGADSQFLVQDNVSLGEPEPDEEDTPKPETGALTWTLFDPVHDEPPPEPEMPEDADPETWVAPVVPPPLPPKVHVQNVLREERMKFYKFPRKGAYLAARVKYNNSIHAEALNAEHLTADPYPEPVEGGEEEEGEAAAEEEPAAAEEVGEGEGDAEGEAAALVIKKELKIWDANTTEVKGVLAVDTMGSGRSFTGQEEEFVQRAAAALSTFLEAMTKHQYQAEVVLQRNRLASNAALAEGAEGRAEANAAALESGMAALQGNGTAAEGEAPAAGEEAPAAEEDAAAVEEEAAAVEEEAAAVVEMSDEEKAKQSTRIASGQATAFVEACSADLSNVMAQLCAPPQGVVDVLSTCCEFVGQDYSKCIDSTTKTMNWSALSSTANVTDVCTGLKAMTGDSVTGEACATWRERLGALDAGDYSGAVAALLAGVTAVLDHCDACEVIRAAEAAAIAAAEEEAAALAAAEAEAAAAAAEEGGDEE